MVLPGLLSLHRAVAVCMWAAPSCASQPATSARLVWPCNSSFRLSCAVRLQGRGREEMFWCFTPTPDACLLTEWFTQGEIRGRGCFPWYPTCSDFLHFKYFILRCPFLTPPCMTAPSWDARQGTQKHPAHPRPYGRVITAATEAQVQPHQKAAWRASAGGPPLGQTGFKRATPAESEGSCGYQRADPQHSSWLRC